VKLVGIRDVVEVEIERVGAVANPVVA